MGLTALQVQGGGLGATAVSEYRGAGTVLRFGDPQAEFAAMRSGCGVYDLGYRAQISLTGADRVRWLNGMVTNNVRDLQPGRGVYAFLLTPQGHILGDLYAYNRGESILVDIDQSQREKVVATLRRYIIMDKVELADVSEKISALGVAGPQATETLKRIGLEFANLEPLQLIDLTWHDVPLTV